MSSNDSDISIISLDKIRLKRFTPTIRSTTTTTKAKTANSYDNHNSLRYDDNKQDIKMMKLSSISLTKGLNNNNKIYNDKPMNRNPLNRQSTFDIESSSSSSMKNEELKKLSTKNQIIKDIENNFNENQNQNQYDNDDDRPPSYSKVDQIIIDNNDDDDDDIDEDDMYVADDNNVIENYSDNNFNNNNISTRQYHDIRSIKSSTLSTSFSLNRNILHHDDDDDNNSSSSRQTIITSQPKKLMETSFHQKHSNYNHSDGRINRSSNNNRLKSSSSSIHHHVNDDDDGDNDDDNYDKNSLNNRSRLSSIQSAELSLEYHKLETTLTTQMMMTKEKLPISNAWNDSSTSTVASTMNLLDNNQNNQKNKRKFLQINNGITSTILSTTTSPMLINNNLQQQQYQLKFTEDYIWKKDRMTIFCFCTTALGAIASLAMYCTE